MGQENFGEIPPENGENEGGIDVIKEGEVESEDTVVPEILGDAGDVLEDMEALGLSGDIPEGKEIKGEEDEE